MRAPVKRLRILSGRHAGAVLDLVAGVHTIGVEDDRDISISDWRHSALELHVEHTGAVTARVLKGQAVVHVFSDLVPCDFKGVLVCVGPPDSHWPDETSLKGAAIQPPVHRAMVARARGFTQARPWVATAVAAALSLLCGAWLIVSLSHEPPPPTLEDTRLSLQATLDGAVPGRLKVTLERSTLIVDGQVDTEAQATMVREKVDVAARIHPVQQRFTVAAQVAETIHGAVALPGAKVRQIGPRVFAFAASTPDAAATRAALDRVAADLSHAVDRIDADLVEVPNQDRRANIASELFDDGLSVIQTRDGTRHIVISGTPVSSPVVPVSNHSDISIATQESRR